MDMSAIGRGGGEISIIVELQEEALDHNTSVSDLLRKALVISRQLQQSDFQVWIEKVLSRLKDGLPEASQRQVRNLILGWAVQLELEGILGEGLTFTPEEQRAAERLPQPSTNLFFQLGEPVQLVAVPANTIQANVSAADLEDLRAFLADLKAEMGSLGLDEEHLAEAATEVDILETLLKSPTPMPAIARESLSVIRFILEGVNDGAAAPLLIQLDKLALGA
jgi:hypothetical protein